MDDICEVTEIGRLSGWNVFIFGRLPLICCLLGICLKGKGLETNTITAWLSRVQRKIQEKKKELENWIDVVYKMSVQFKALSIFIQKPNQYITRLSASPSAMKEEEQDTKKAGIEDRVR